MASVHVFHVRGQVTTLPAWTDKEPAELMLQPEDEENEIHLPDAIVDEHGAFDVKGVAPGLYTVWLSPTRARGLEARQDAGTPQIMRIDQTVQVADGDVNDLRMTPIANGWVRGRLRMDSGQKTDWSEAVVKLRGDSETASDRMVVAREVAGAIVKRDGSFETLALAGTYHLQFSRADSVPPGHFVKAVNLGGKDVADSGFNVGGGTLSLDVVIGANAATVEGVVRDDKDTPALDAQVICIPEANRSGRRDLYRRVTTDTRGHFSLVGLNPGEYRMFALDEDLEDDEITDPEFARTHESLGQTIDLKEGEHKSIELKLAVSSD